MAELTSASKILDLLLGPGNPPLIQVRYRGSYANFQRFYKVAVNLRALDMYITNDAGFPFEAGYGPFPHTC